MVKVGEIKRRYKVGDRVVLKDLREGDVKGDGPATIYVSERMENYMGTTVTISEVLYDDDYSYHYHIKEDGDEQWFYHDCMIDHEATAKLGSSGITAFEIEEGIEYEDVVTGDLFKLTDTGVLLINTGKGYKQSNLRYKSLKSLRLKEVPETFPKEGDIYYFVDVTDGELDVDFHYYRDSYMHNNIIDSVPIFKNKQDAENFCETISAFMKQAIKDFSAYTI